MSNKPEDPNMEIETLSDDDLESVSGGMLEVDNTGTGTCYSSVSNPCTNSGSGTCRPNEE